MVAVQKQYVPDRGEVVWVDLDPPRGHEQAKRRPALVLSPKNYNRKAGLVLIVPITSQAKGYSFEVPVQGNKIDGVVLADQVRSVDWRARKVTFLEKVPVRAVSDVQELLTTLIRE